MRLRRYGKGECDRCGFIFRLRELRYEWSGAKVCPKCWDPLPAQDFPRPLRAESEALVDPRPEQDLLVRNGHFHADEWPVGVAWYGEDLQAAGTDPVIL